MRNNVFATVYEQLADHLATRVPELGWIDLDQGQLEQEDESYSLPYNLGICLISFSEVDWQDRGQGIQRGDALITFTLAIEVAADSYQHSTQRAAALLKLELLGKIHQALSHHGGLQFGALVRSSSQKEAAQPGLWIYSQTYKSQLTDAEGYEGTDRVAIDLDTQPRPQAFILQ